MTNLLKTQFLEFKNHEEGDDENYNEDFDVEAASRLSFNDSSENQTERYIGKLN